MNDKEKLKTILSNISQIFKPPRDVKINEWLDANMRLAEGGMFDSSITPYLIEPINLLTDRETEMIIYVSPARGGKSLTLITGAMFYAILEEVADTLIVHVTAETAKRYSKATIKRAVHNSPAFDDIRPVDKNNDNVLSKSFRNGAMLQIGFPATSQLAGADYRFVLITDSDRTTDENSDGDWIAQAKKRTTTFGSGGMTVVESSPSRPFMDSDYDGNHPHDAPPVEGIIGLYNSGDKRIEYWNCLHCDEEIMLKPNYDLFCIPNMGELVDEVMLNGETVTANKYAKLVCPHCGGIHSSSDRKKLASTSKWRKAYPDEPNNKIKSFWGSGYSSAFMTWEQILLNYIQAVIHFLKTGNEGKLETATNLDMGGVYIPQTAISKITSKMLKERADIIENVCVPKKVRYILASIDSQKNKFVINIQGFGVDGESWVIDRFDIIYSNRENKDHKASFDYEPIRPASYAEDWHLITEQVINAKYEIAGENGVFMGVHHTVCDMHGLTGSTENAYRYAMALKSKGLQNRFTLLRGERPTPRSNQPLVVPSKVQKSSVSGKRANARGLVFLRVNTTLGKDTVMALLSRDKAGSGYIHMPSYLPDRVFEELTVEVRTSKGWDNPKGKRNEEFDLLTYNLANNHFILSKLRGGHINWDNPPPFARKWNESNINVEGLSDVKNEIEQDEHDRLLELRKRRY